MATYKSNYTGPQIDQAVSHAVNMDVNPTAGHTDRVVSSGGVKSAIDALVPVRIQTLLPSQPQSNGAIYALGGSMGVPIGIVFVSSDPVQVGGFFIRGGDNNWYYMCKKPDGSALVPTSITVKILYIPAAYL